MGSLLCFSGAGLSQAEVGSGPADASAPTSIVVRLRGNAAGSARARPPEPEETSAYQRVTKRFRAGRWRRLQPAGARRPARRGQEARARRSPPRNAEAAERLRSRFSRTFVVPLPAGQDLKAALAEIQADPRVEWAEASALYRAAYTPNDPFFTNGTLWGLNKVQAPAAWDIARGTGVVVAVSDTGTQLTHPDLAANLWTNPGEVPANGVDDDGNGFVDDIHGWDFVDNDNQPVDGHSHGTHVAGTIAAVGHNALGVVGLAFNARIMTVQGLNAVGSGSDFDLTQGLLYAVDNGADVINCSWGGDAPSRIMEEGFAYAHNHGVVVAAAAGNDYGLDALLRWPAAYGSVITVAATASNDTLASFSNIGRKLDVSAPGVNIYSTVLGTAYGYKNGTSMASPHVAGLAALILSLHPGYNKEQVRLALRASVDDLGAPGFDTTFGYGRINALKALQLPDMPEIWVSEPRPGDLVTGTVEVRGTAGGAGFESYTVASGAGPWPASFTTIAGPLPSPVADGLLATWNAGTPAEGEYALKLTVRSGGKDYPLVISPLRAGSPPVVQITHPAPGSKVPRGLILVTADATDNVGVSRVDFAVDGVWVSSSAAPYTWPWNASAAPTGRHEIWAQTRDAAGFETTAVSEFILEASVASVAIEATAVVP